MVIIKDLYRTCKGSIESVLLAGDPGGIQVVDACQAQVLLRYSEGLDETFDADICQTVGTDDLPDLFDGMGGGDELVPRFHIHTVVTGCNDGGTSDPHMDFLRTGIPEHSDQLLESGSPDDTVIHDQDLLSVDR